MTMKNFRRLSLALAMTVAFAVPALAGETQSPPCPDPGEMSTPPCTAPGDMQGPGAPVQSDATAGDTTPGEMQGPGLTWDAILFAIQSVM
jgi:hypothetical protein